MVTKYPSTIKTTTLRCTLSGYRCDASPAATSSVYAFSNFDPFNALYEVLDSPSAWMCQSYCDGNGMHPITHKWTPFGQEIDYCLSQKKEDHCTLEFSLVIMIVVICCNAAKAIAMTLAIRGDEDEILVTIGHVLLIPFCLSA